MNDVVEGVAGSFQISIFLTPLCATSSHSIVTDFADQMGNHGQRNNLLELILLHLFFFRCSFLDQRSSCNIKIQDENRKKLNQLTQFGNGDETL